MVQNEILLEAQGITKVFGTLHANDEVDLIINSGEIHALLGENGAGKSTLVKILFGALHPTSGKIFWRGREVHITNPALARELGIGMVFQHFSLFEALTVKENIALSLGKAFAKEALSQKIIDVSTAYGLPLDPNSLVADLSVGERQRIEIVRCLLQEPSLIILDEPTSVLTPQEADQLFVTLERLRDEGKSLLYISHRLEEVQRLCSRATIMRHGKVIEACDPRQENASTLAAKMVGKAIDKVERHSNTTEGEVVLKLNGLSMPAKTQFSTALKNINLDVRAGEVMGVAGIAGNGQSEFFEAVSGEALQKNANMIEIDGKPVGHMDISQRRAEKAAFVPEERLGHGAIPSFTLTQNLLLSRHSSDHEQFTYGGKLGFINESALTATSEAIIKDKDVRMSGKNPNASSLSGGNLQKYIMGRELDRAPKLLIVNQPTWGVDAGAAAHIRQCLIDLAESGSAVLVISQDLDEIEEVSDKVVVISEGELSAPIDAKTVTREDIGLLMAGLTNSSDDNKQAAGA